jgi:hypothetical protein
MDCKTFQFKDFFHLLTMANDHNGNHKSKRLIFDPLPNLWLQDNAKLSISQSFLLHLPSLMVQQSLFSHLFLSCIILPKQNSNMALWHCLLHQNQVNKQIFNVYMWSINVYKRLRGKKVKQVSENKEIWSKLKNWH